MNTLTINQKMFIAALVGFIIGATAVWVWSVAPTSPQAQSEKNEEATMKADTSSRSGSADVQAPSAAVAQKVVTGTTPMIAVVGQPAGSRVAFSTLLNEAGWVVVHEDRAGEPGNILGAQWLPAGTHAGEVTLLRNTETGKTYHVILYADDGDREFEVHGEAKLVVEGGNPISTTFVAQ